MAEELSAQRRVHRERDLFVAHELIGDVLLAQGDPAAALESYQASLTIAAGHLAADPEDASWWRSLSDSHDTIGDVLMDQEPRRRPESYQAS
jgi:hypothetical protein